MAKVLLVEDDNNLRDIYETRIQAEGYDTVTAKDGEEALAVIKQEMPDLVITDAMMPHLSGLEMMDIIRNTPETAGIKIIMLTALGQSDDRDRAKQLGADRYLVKSQVTLEDIITVAHELLNDAEPEPAVVEANPVVPQYVTSTLSEAPAAAEPEPVPVAPIAAPTPTVVAPAPVAQPEPIIVPPPLPPAPVAPSTESSVPAGVETMTFGAPLADVPAPQQPVIQTPVATAVVVTPAPAPVAQPEPQTPNDTLIANAASQMAVATSSQPATTPVADTITAPAPVVSEHASLVLTPTPMSDEQSAVNNEINNLISQAPADPAPMSEVGAASMVAGSVPTTQVAPAAPVPGQNPEAPAPSVQAAMPPSVPVTAPVPTTPAQTPFDPNSIAL